MLHFVFVHLFNSNRKFNVIIISIIIVIKIIVRFHVTDQRLLLIAFHLCEHLINFRDGRGRSLLHSTIWLNSSETKSVEDLM